MGAAIGTLALAGAIVATPGVAMAQDGELAAANQWVTDQIQAPAAWETTKGEGVTVAVIDSGISEHPFFEGKNVEPGFSVFPEEEDAWNDQHGHGTGVAAAVLLAAPEATLLPVRSNIGGNLADQGLTGAAEAGQIESIRWAVDNGADVLVMSWGIADGDPTDEFLEVLQYAIDKGVVPVASAGNDPNSDIAYPAGIPGVVTVSGTDQAGGVWESSTTGPEVTVAAPASEMLIPNVQEEDLGWGDDTSQELYMTVNGTSLSAGFVGGVVAMALAADPELDGNNAINRLIQTAGDGGGDEHTEELGYGLVNADQAVNAEGIEPVNENPLGYPMGEPGASGAGTEEEESAEGSEEGSSEASPSTAAAEKSGTGISTIIIVAAAVVLVAAAITVWLVLRGRSRKQAVAAGSPNGFGGEGGPVQQGGYAPPTGQGQPQYGPPPGGGQNFSPPPPTGGQQHYSPPMNTGESSPPWGPGNDPNQRR